MTRVSYLPMYVHKPQHNQKYKSIPVNDINKGQYEEYYYSKRPNSKFIYGTYLLQTKYCTTCQVGLADIQTAEKLPLPHM